MEETKKRFATEAELERMFCISKSTWRRLRTTGDGPIFYKMPNKVLYQIDEVVEWLDKHKRQSTSQYKPHQKGRLSTKKD